MDEGVPKEGTKIRTLSPLRRFRQGPSYSPNRLVSQSAITETVNTTAHIKNTARVNFVKIKISNLPNWSNVYLFFMQAEKNFLHIRYIGKSFDLPVHGKPFLPYSQSYPHDLPRMTSLSPTGGWMISSTTWFARKVTMTSQANMPKRQRVRLDSSNFSTFTSEKYLLQTYRRKIINIYCPLVIEKSTNPRVKLTCPCLGKPRHGLS